MEPADRLSFVKEYYFSRKLEEIHQMKSKGNKIINFGVGSPDLPPPLIAVKEMKLAIKNKKSHKYQNHRGIIELRQAFTKFYENKFNVKLNPITETLPLLGSKEGILYISMAFLNRGDEVLVPNPGYPTYASAAKMLGCRVVEYDLSEDTEWQPDFCELEKRDLSKVKIMWMNYPHMPTGVNAKSGVFLKAISFARKNNILLINDNPYSFILNKTTPQSILACSNSKDIALELNSLSKTFNMSGWRVGVVLGNKKNINSIHQIKSNVDSGMFFPVQIGALHALKVQNEWYKKLNLIYSKRQKKMVKLIQKLNCTLESRLMVGMFIWARIPKRYKSSKNFSDMLLYKYHLFVVPGFVFGSNGEGYVRFSLCIDEASIECALKRISYNKI